MKCIVLVVVLSLALSVKGQDSTFIGNPKIVHIATTATYELDSLIKARYDSLNIEPKLIVYSIGDIEHTILPNWENFKASVTCDHCLYIVGEFDETRVNFVFRFYELLNEGNDVKSAYAIVSTEYKKYTHFRHFLNWK